MRNQILLAVAFVASLCSREAQQHATMRVKESSAQKAEETQQIGMLDYDPFAALALFLRAVYPDLDSYQGLASLQTGFGSGTFQFGNVGFEFYPCRMSGVSVQPSPIPYCGTAPEKPFLKASLSFGQDRQRPSFLDTTHAAALSVEGWKTCEIGSRIRFTQITISGINNVIG
jgi:hypothetical protein